MRDRQKPQEKSVNVTIDEPKDHDPKSRAFGGSKFGRVNHWLANQVINTLPQHEGWTQAERDERASRAVATMIGLAPKDETEGLLVAQMVAAHAASMEMIRRAMVLGQPVNVQSEYLNLANKLSRTHAALSETLLRKRSGGQQKIIVERIQVAPGGQAVLGNVTQTLGGGAAQKEVLQSHEHETPAGRLAPPSESPLPCAIEADQAEMRSPSRTG